MRGKKIDGFVTRRQALADFFAAWEPAMQTEEVSLAQAAGRICADRVYSKLTLPVYRVSSCDGIAVAAGRVQNEREKIADWRIGIDFARADTGDDFEDCFDAVIPIEEIDLDPDGKIAFLSPDVEIKAGSNTSPRGSTLVEGDLLMEGNLPIRATDLASLAMGGANFVKVWRKPRVAFIPTGSELIPPGNTPKRGENIDTNSMMVQQMLLEFGAEPVMYPIVRDNPKELERTLKDALSTVDIVVLNAGTAKGSEDFNTPMLGDNGKLIHHYVAAAPGRPMALAVVDHKPVINLPGPAMAAFFGMDWCVRAAINRFLNQPMPQRERITGRLMESIRSTEHMATLTRINVRKEGEDYLLYPLSLHRYSLPLCLASNAMYVSEVGEAGVEKGEEIEVELLRGREMMEGRMRS